MSTTNPGRFSFSVPRPYVTHEPIEGCPWRGEPVKSNNSAGVWLNWSVFMDLITHKSSAASWSLGIASDIQMPLLPYCANCLGVPISLGTPEVKANLRPFRNSSGQGFSFHLTSSGL